MARSSWTPGSGLRCLRGSSPRRAERKNRPPRGVVTRMRDDIRPGAKFPDYELPDHTGTRRKLSELQGTDPMILVLSRGAFCPKDRQQHRLLVELEPEIRVAYTKIVTIS